MPRIFSSSCALPICVVLLLAGCGPAEEEQSAREAGLSPPAEASHVLSPVELVAPSEPVKEVSEAVDGRAVFEGAAAYVNELESAAVDLDLSMHAVIQGIERHPSAKCALEMRGKEELHMAIGEEGMAAVVLRNAEKQTTYFVKDNAYIEEETSTSREAFIGMMAAGPMRAATVWVGGFLHGAEAELAEATGIVHEGAEEIDGVAAEHLRVTAEAYDLELWVAAGEEPLPLRMRMNLDRSMAGAAQAHGQVTTMTLGVDFSNWRVNPELATDRFVFEPPEGATLRAKNAPSRSSGAEPMAGKAAPNFSLELLGGGKVELASHKGKDVVLLEFFASWCGPCRKAMPGAARVAAKYKDRGLVFYGVNLRESPDRILSFLKLLKLDIPVLLDKEATVARDYGANSIPRAVLIGKDGLVKAAHTGGGPGLEGILEAEVEAALKEGKGAG